MGTFVCEISEGDGKDVEFSWISRGRLLRDGHRIRVISSEESSILKISNVGHNDSGNYTCVAKTRRSEARVTTRLRVEG